MRLSTGTTLLVVGLIFSVSASAEPLDENNPCFGQRQKQDDDAQQNHMLNFFAGATTMSPLHGPMGSEPGHGSLGVDFYLASTMGIDAMVGKKMGKWTPYLSVGVLDVSTIFYVDDTGVMVNNSAPYFGPAISVGTEADLHDRIALAAEFYSAPGVIYTGRVRAGLRF